MMISPETYYELYLKGKNEKQIMTTIRGLKQEIGRLKNAMETPGPLILMDPSESVMLSCTRSYLEYAKNALAEKGGTYKPSRTELRVADFDASIPSITKVVLSIGGCSRGYVTRTVTLDEGDLHFDIEYSLMKTPSGLSKNCDYHCTKEDFLDGIRELHLGEWRRNYVDNNMLDGTQWNLTVEFFDRHKPFKSGGSNAYPYNFDDLLKLFGIDEPYRKK